MMLTVQLQTSSPSDSATAAIDTDDVMQYVETIAVEGDTYCLITHNFSLLCFEADESCATDGKTCE